MAFFLTPCASEFHDFIRVYSKVHGGEMYICDNAEISSHEIASDSPWGERNPGYLININGHIGAPFFIAQKDTKWYCDECGDYTISYTEPKVCLHCKDNED